MGKSRFLLVSLVAAGVMALGACVTINVYFPAAEAQQAAEEFVEKVIGDEAAKDEPQAYVPARRGFNPLDLLISPAAAQLQVTRVATARGCATATVTALVAQQTQAPQWGVLGEPRVAVLPLNLALDQACPQQGQ